MGYAVLSGLCAHCRWPFWDCYWSNYDEKYYPDGGYYYLSLKEKKNTTKSLAQRKNGLAHRTNGTKLAQNEKAQQKWLEVDLAKPCIKKMKKCSRKIKKLVA